MKRFFLALALPLILAGSFVAVSEIVVPQQAEAARFGGGRSFGSRPAIQRPMAPARQPAAPQQGMAQSAGAAGAMRGGFLGPLLAGSMLGALFFGGAFSGIGMADILVILLGVYILTRVLRGRRQAAENAAASGPSGGNTGGYSAGNPGGRYGSASSEPGFAKSSGPGDPWARLRDSRASAADAGPTGQSRAAASGPTLPADFDLEDFLAGAKLMFTRLQESWDKRDLSDIAEFSTPEVVAEISRQAEEDPEPSRTDIMMINAEFLGLDQGAAQDTASVHFKVLLRERREEDVQEISEIWHFGRNRQAGATSTWKLAGIQQD